jgi:hypothetical protein
VSLDEVLLPAGLHAKSNDVVGDHGIPRQWSATRRAAPRADVSALPFN